MYVSNNHLLERLVNAYLAISCRVDIDVRETVVGEKLMEQGIMSADCSQLYADHDGYHTWHLGRSCKS
jgi:hypothetical protein